VDVRPRFEYGNRFVGVGGLDDLEPGLSDHFRRVHPQQIFIFDDQNDRSVDFGSPHDAFLAQLSTHLGKEAFRMTELRADGAPRAP